MIYSSDTVIESIKNSFQSRYKNLGKYIITNWMRDKLENFTDLE